ncbi:MAG: site-2 protease family protein [Anaerolineales bacterium]
MFKTRLNLGKILGIPLYIDVSWLLIFVWVTWSLAGGYFPERYPSWSGTTAWGIGALTSLLFFGSVLLHELGHSLVSRAQGVPVDNITLFIFGGAAQISDEPRTSFDEFVMAIAGPLVSLLLSGFFALIYLSWGNKEQPVAALALFLGGINLSLGVFNLIPGFPLDGGRVLRALLWRLRGDFRWATKWASRVGQMVAYAFVIVGILRAFSGYWVNGLWIAMIGFFLDNASRTAYARLSARDLLRGHTVEQVMSRDCHTVSPQLSLDMLVEHHLMGNAGRCFVVTRGESPLGMLTLHNIREVPRVDWPFTHVEDVLLPLGQLRTVHPLTPLWEALEEMTAEGVNQLPVLDDGVLRGMITREDVITFIHDRADRARAQR